MQFIFGIENVCRIRGKQLPGVSKPTVNLLQLYPEWGLKKTFKKNKAHYHWFKLESSHIWKIGNQLNIHCI